MKILKWTVFIGVCAIAVVAWSLLNFWKGSMGIFWFINDLIAIITRSGLGNLTGVGLIVGPVWALYSFAPLIVLMIVLYIRAKILSKQGIKPLVSAPTILRVSLSIMMVLLVAGFAIIKWNSVLFNKKIALHRKQQQEESAPEIDPKIVDEFKKTAIVKVKVSTIVRADVRFINDIEARKAKRIQWAKDNIVNPIGSNDFKVLTVENRGDNGVYFDAEVTKKGYEQLKKNMRVWKMQLIIPETYEGQTFRIGDTWTFKTGPAPDAKYYLIAFHKITAPGWFYENYAHDRQMSRDGSWTILPAHPKYADFIAGEDVRVEFRPFIQNRWGDSKFVRVKIVGPKLPPAGAKVLTATISGESSLLNPGGRIVSVPGGAINCGSDCVEIYEGTPTITLKAVANDGYVFKEWVNCDYLGAVTDPTCQVVMNSSKTITAAFAKADA